MAKNVEGLVVKSKVKEYIKSVGDFNVSSDLYDELNSLVASEVKAAVGRTKANGRKTVSAKDI